MAQTVAKFDTGHEGQIHDCVLDYYGGAMATCGADGTIKIWNVSNPEAPQPRTELKGHTGAVWKVDWAHPKFPDLLASCGYDRQVIIWKLPNHIAYKDELARGSVNCVRFAPFEAGLHLACGSSDGTVAILSYGDNQAWSRSTFSAHPCGVLSLCWSNTNASAVQRTSLEGTRMATGGMDAAVKVWRHDGTQWQREDVDNGQQNHKDWVTTVNWRPASEVIASGSKDGVVIIWEFSGNAWKATSILQNEFRGQPVWSVEFAQVGGMLCVSYGQNQSAVFKETSGGAWQQTMDIDDAGVGGGGNEAGSVNSNLQEAFGMS